MASQDAPASATQTVTATRTVIERLARHLAAGHPETWQDRVADAASLLAILKEPDATMIDAGDAAVWRRMIDTALENRWQMEASLSGRMDSVPDGSDEEGETRLGHQSGVESKKSWVHVDPK